MIGKIFLLITLLLIGTTFAAEKINSTFPDITGNYKCRGYDPDDKGNYTNVISVKKMGANYSFQWLDNNGYPTAYGTGVVNTNLPNTIAVAYENLTYKTNTGIILYTFKDGSLKGTWTFKGYHQLGSDNCQKK